MWISPQFKIYIVKEFQRLKNDEQLNLGWSAKRELAKINYHIHTAAIKKEYFRLTAPQYEGNILFNFLHQTLNKNFKTNKNQNTTAKDTRFSCKVSAKFLSKE